LSLSHRAQLGAALNVPKLITEESTTMDRFKFELGQQVRFAVSGEVGQVIGRAEYKTAEPNYFVRYKRADGVGCQDWWAESAVEPA
jgi:hypothetical protein